MEQLLFDLKLVSSNRKMFSLSRALKQTGEVLHTVFVKLLQEHGRQYLHELQQRIQKKKADDQERCVCQCDLIDTKLQQMHAYKETVLGQKLRKIRLIEIGIAIIDIAIPTILILAVTHLAALGKQLLSSNILLSGLVVLATLIKVSLDRRLAIPLVERLGWKAFEQVRSLIHQEIVDVLAAMFILEWWAQHWHSPINLINSVEMRIQALQKSSRTINSTQKI